MPDYPTINWYEATPSGTSGVDILDTEIQNLRQSLRSALDDEHHWDSTAGGAVRGTHRQGSARVFLDVESNLSQSGTSYVGRLYVASDTSRLFCVPDSGQTMFLGGSMVPEMLSFGYYQSPTTYYPGQNIRWVTQSGVVFTSSIASSHVTFTPAYSHRPMIFHALDMEGPYATGHSVLSSADGSGATFDVHSTAGASQSNRTLFWMSVGTVAF